MSIPINHHYVSQCQIKNFFSNEGKIFLYDKPKQNFYSKTSSKNIFSEKFSNSIYKDGKIDHETLENDLKIFEDEYTKAVKLISETSNTLKITKECHHALLNIALFGIIGRYRNPKAKQELDDILDHMFDKFKDDMSSKQLADLNKTTEYRKHVKHSNMLAYAESALRIAEKMGGIVFTVWHIKSEDCFLLPDTSAISIRHQINKAFNPYIRNIAEVGFPLTDKIFIHALSKKLVQDKSHIVIVDTNKNQAITDINYNLFHYAYETIATSNESYLKFIVSKVKDDVT